MIDDKTVKMSDLDWTEFHRVNDVEALYNMRDWMRKAVESLGAKMVGSGCGLGEVDLDIELEGYLYNIAIKPLPTRSRT